MKILIVSQYFWPEDFRINDIAKGLKEQGHQVEVLTGVPNYPKGEKFKDFSLLKKTHKEYEGIKVYRTPIFVRGKSGALRMILNYISFMIIGSFRAIPFLFKKYDRIFVFQISPITSAIPALFISKIKNIKSYIYVQDLWPETFYSIVNIRNKKVRSLMKKICNKIYDAFSVVLIASQGYRDILVEEGLNDEKIKYFPQWAEDFYSMESKNNVIKKSEEFSLVFAGNIGKAQSVETIIKAANHTKKIREDIKIKWKIIGDGSEFENVKSLAKEYELDDIIEFLGRKPSNTMPQYFVEADGLIVTLKNENILKVTLPAKVQSYMAAQKPILASISGEGKSVIEEAKCGLTSEAEDFVALSYNAIKLCEMSFDEREKLALNGSKYFEKNFTRKILLEKLEDLLI